MKIKRLTSLLLLLCLVFCACRSGPTSETTADDLPLQTAHVDGIRLADSIETEESIEFPTEEPETEPPAGIEISCLYDFFREDIDIEQPEETIPPDERPLGGWPDPSDTPHTDRSNLYGTTYRFRLTADWSWHQFCFRYDVIEKQLAVVLTETHFSATKIAYPLLLIFQVHNARDWDDIVRIVEEDQYISATLLHARNIDVDRTQNLRRAFQLLREIPFEEDSLTPFRQYILGYAVYDDVTYLIAASEHDAIEQIDYIISVYGEDPS